MAKKFAQLEKRTVEELKNLLEGNQEKLRQLRFDLAAGKVKDVKEVSRVKKEVAQILTLLKQKI